MSSNEKTGCLKGLLRMIGFGKNGKAANLEEEQVLPYLVRDDFFSPAEGSFFRVLKEVVKEDFTICPKVSLREIFFVSKPNENMAYYNRIDRKHIDYLLCDPKTLKPALGIELDDASHKRADRVERDTFVNRVFADAGLKLLHVPAKTAYSTKELHQLIYEGQSFERSVDKPAPAGSIQAPVCPKCGIEMVLRTASKGANVGKQFYGCPNYPRCREVS
jgi:hypothetical protein